MSNLKCPLRREHLGQSFETGGNYEYLFRSIDPERHSVEQMS